MNREETRVFTAQLAIRVSEALTEILEPAGLSLTLICESFESHFDELWPVHTDPNNSETDITTPDDKQTMYVPTPPFVRPPPLFPAPIVSRDARDLSRTRPDVAGLMRCGSATLLGYRCSRRILVPYTVCDVHVKYFWKHGTLPVGGAGSPESLHPDDAGDPPNPTPNTCTCHIIRHICEACQPLLR